MYIHSIKSECGAEKNSKCVLQKCSSTYDRVNNSYYYYYNKYFIIHLMNSESGCVSHTDSWLRLYSVVCIYVILIKSVTIVLLIIILF